MQMSRWAFGAIVAGCGVAGLALTAAVVFSLPYQYQSTAILKMETPGGAPAGTETVQQLAEAALTPTALMSMIHSFHLYAGGAADDQAIKKMRRAIRVEPAASSLVKVSFAYEDPTQAQQVSQDLVSRIISANISQSAGPNGLLVQLAAPSDQPRKLGEGKRHGLAHLGLPGGMLFGVVLALVLRRRKPAAN